MVINIMFMNCTYVVFMLRASLPEGTHGVTNVGGLTANQTLGVTHALMVLYLDRMCQCKLHMVL